MFKWHIITLFFIQSFSLEALVTVIFVCVFWNRVSAAQVTWSMAKNTQCCFEFLSILLMPPLKHQDRKHGPPHLDTFVFFMFVKERYKESSSPKANIMLLNFSELHTHWKKNSLWMESNRTNCTHSFWPYYKPNCALLSTHISKFNS